MQKCAWQHRIWMAAFALCAAVHGAVARSFEPVAEGVELLRGEFVPGKQPDGNTVMLRGRKGWTVIDSGRHAEHTQQIIDHARQSGLPISDLINTHWHLDHVSGNGLLRDAYPALEVHASNAIAAAMEGFLLTYRRQLIKAIASQPDSPQRADWEMEIKRMDQSERLYPTKRVAAIDHRRLGGRSLDLHLSYDAATDGDVWVYDRKTRTLIAGDLVTLPVPFMDTACATGWTSALDAVDRVPFTRLVPGHGPVLDREQFRRYRQAFNNLHACASGPSTAAQCAAGWNDDLGDLLPPSEHARSRELLDYYISRRMRDPKAQMGCAAS